MSFDGSSSCRSTTIFWWWLPNRRIRWSRITSPPPCSISRSSDRLDSLFSFSRDMCDRQTSPRTHTPRCTASVNSSATVGPSSRSFSSGSPRQSVKKRWSPAFSERTSSTRRSK